MKDNIENLSKIKQKDKEIGDKISPGDCTSKCPEGKNRKSEGIKLFFKRNSFEFPKIKKFQIESYNQCIVNFFKNYQCIEIVKS